MAEMRSQIDNLAKQLSHSNITRFFDANAKSSTLCAINWWGLEKTPYS